MHLVYVFQGVATIKFPQLPEILSFQVANGQSLTSVAGGCRHEDDKYIVVAGLLKHSIPCWGYVVEERLRPGRFINRLHCLWKLLSTLFCKSTADHVRLVVELLYEVSVTIMNYLEIYQMPRQLLLAIKVPWC